MVMIQVAYEKYNYWEFPFLTVIMESSLFYANDEQILLIC